MARNKVIVVAMFVLSNLLVSVQANQADVGSDPFETFNRKMFQFNTTADRYLLKPIAKVYDKLTPQFVNNGITRFFKNLSEPVSSLNALLQGKPVNASRNLGRFVLNTTVGVLGVMDVATKLGLEAETEDFGQTLAVWGVNSGPYLMLPLLGPSTFRGVGAKIPASYTNPVSYVDHVPTKNTLIAVELIDARADVLSMESLISGDRYIFIRDTYFQRLEYNINDGDIADSFEDDFGDFGDEEDY